jgi:hypothetical protein
MPKRVRCLLVLFGVLFVLYVGSYYVLSRRGYAEADRYNMGKCFYYFPPENTDSWRFRNYTWGTCFCLSTQLIDGWASADTRRASHYGV